MADTLRIGLAGAGAISQYHLFGWSEMADAQVVASRDVDETRTRAKAHAFHVPRVYTDFRATFEQEKLDTVDIVTPVGSHVPLTRLAAVAGLHRIRTGSPCSTDRLDNLETLKLMESSCIAAGVKF